MTKKISLKMMTKYFNYLDKLRESGAANMFGASLWLQEAYDIEHIDVARDILGKWMDTFDLEVSPQDRAKKVLES